MSQQYGLSGAQHVEGGVAGFTGGGFHPYAFFIGDDDGDDEGVGAAELAGLVGCVVGHLGGPLLQLVVDDECRHLCTCADCPGGEGERIRPTGKCDADPTGSSVGIPPCADSCGDCPHVGVTSAAEGVGVG